MKRISKIVKLRQSGKSYGEIAKLLGTSRQAVEQAYKRHLARGLTR